jgi:hypothetical protein
MTTKDTQLTTALMELTGCTAEVAQLGITRAIEVIEQNKDTIPIQEAFLKHDLYKVEERHVRWGYYKRSDIPKLGKKILSKGSRFVYFNPEGWYNDGGVIDGEDDGFAQDHLTEPVDIKGNK